MCFAVNFVRLSFIFNTHTHTHTHTQSNWSILDTCYILFHKRTKQVKEQVVFCINLFDIACFYIFSTFTCTWIIFLKIGKDHWRDLCVIRKHTSYTQVKAPFRRKPLRINFHLSLSVFCGSVLSSFQYQIVTLIHNGNITTHFSP